MTFHYNNNNQEPTGSCNDLLVVPCKDGKADIITKLLVWISAVSSLYPEGGAGERASPAPPSGQREETAEIQTTKLRKLNYCAKPFESSYKNKLITKSLIFKTRFYVNISTVTATFLLTLEICVHLSCLEMSFEYLCTHDSHLGQFAPDQSFQYLVFYGYIKKCNLAHKV